MRVFSIVLGIVLFLFAIFSVYLGITAITKGKSGNTKYNKMRETFDSEKRSRRDRIIAASRFVLAVSAVALGISIITGGKAAEWIGLILIAGCLVMDSIAMRK